MTDKEIIKALECCVSEGNTTCKECPLFEHKIKFEGLRCDTIMIQSALDLINRQQAEIEGLIAGQKILNKCVSKVKAEAIKEFAERLRKKAFLSKGWQAVAVYDITALVKEMTEVQQ